MQPLGPRFRGDDGGLLLNGGSLVKPYDGGLLLNGGSLVKPYDGGLLLNGDSLVKPKVIAVFSALPHCSG